MLIQGWIELNQEIAEPCGNEAEESERAKVGGR